MIHKAKGQVPLTQVSKEILRDPNLSMKAKGLWSYLFSMPEDSVIHKSELHKHFKDGLTSVRSAFDELVSFGLIEALEVRKTNGQFQTMEYIVYEEPVNKTKTK